MLECCSHLVLALEVRGEAHVAGDAVEEVVPAADPADAAAVAVELRLKKFERL